MYRHLIHNPTIHNLDSNVSEESILEDDIDKGHSFFSAR